MNTKLWLIRKMKANLLRMRIDSFMSFLANPMEMGAQMVRMSKWRKQHPPQYMNDFYSRKVDLDKRYDLYKAIDDKIIKNGPISYLEFGVATGKSFRWWVAENTNPDSRFYGFDTFNGLPEDFGPFKKGAFSNGNKPPEIEDDRIEWQVGLFQQTLPGFLKERNFNEQLVIHLDADLYTATLFVLTSLSPFLKQGDILLFDEFNVPLHEFKAFTEFVNSYYLKYEVLGAVNNYFQVAIRLQ